MYQSYTRFQCFIEVFRVLKPGGSFVGYDWCLTDRYDAQNAEHRETKRLIEEGDGLPDLRITHELVSDLKSVGFSLEESQIIPEGDIPWYQPLKGGIPERQNGSLVSMENGTAIPYSIDKLQERGKFFIDPGEDIYEGQVIGENSRGDDMVINVTKTKKLTNVRSAGADDKAKIVPAVKFSLEEALEYIQKDEYVEVTPNHIRLRKVLLKEVDRKRNKAI